MANTKIGIDYEAIVTGNVRGSPEKVVQWVLTTLDAMANFGLHSDWFEMAKRREAPDVFEVFWCEFTMVFLPWEPPAKAKLIRELLSSPNFDEVAARFEAKFAPLDRRTHCTLREKFEYEARAMDGEFDRISLSQAEELQKKFLWEWNLEHVRTDSEMVQVTTAAPSTNTPH